MCALLSDDALGVKGGQAVRAEPEPVPVDLGVVLALVGLRGDVGDGEAADELLTAGSSISIPSAPHLPSSVAATGAPRTVATSSTRMPVSGSAPGSAGGGTSMAPLMAEAVGRGKGDVGRRGGGEQRPVLVMRRGLTPVASPRTVRMSHAMLGVDPLGRSGAITAFPSIRGAPRRAARRAMPAMRAQR